MKIEDKAKETPEVSLARQSAPGAYILDGKELVPADDLTPEGEFPKYGDFLPVKRPRATDVGHEPAGVVGWIECPQGLARWLVDEGIGVGDGFRIKRVQKIDGEWDYEAERLSD